jgi:hypothetical protein
VAVSTSAFSTKGRDAEALIRDRRSDAKVRFELLDLASLTSVAAFADRMLARRVRSTF